MGPPASLVALSKNTLQLVAREPSFLRDSTDPESADACILEHCLAINIFAQDAFLYFGMLGFNSRSV